MDWVSLVAAVFALIAGGVAAGVAHQFLRLEATLGKHQKVASEELRTELATVLKRANLELSTMSDQVEEMIDRARAERRRENGRKGGRPPDAPEAPEMSKDQYLSHLERGGHTIAPLELRYFGQ